MRISKYFLALGVLALGVATLAHADPEADRKAYVKFYQDRFPDAPLVEFANGTYGINETARESWLAYEEFPPYELDIDAGKELFDKPFANGKSMADCFENGGIGIRQNYPYFDTRRKEVITLELAINECREANGEKPFKWKKGPIMQVSAYMAYTSRDKPVNVKIPNKDALAAYEEGKEHYYTKRGQLNFSCADCHMFSAGQNARADLLSPGLGHVTGFPVYRIKWEGAGTLHRRLEGCWRDSRSIYPKAQSKELRRLEYFMTYMSNGLPVNGPSVRK